jgi:hypothetical protein
MKFCTHINIPHKKPGMKYFTSTIEKMATERNVEVIPDKFNIVRIY